ncbi:MAG: lantibiotic dehydratase [Terracidiphilus sp.]
MTTVRELHQPRDSRLTLYEVLEGACLRAPLLPITDSRFDTLDPANLEVVGDPVVQYALTIASPSLIEEYNRTLADRDRPKLDTVRRKLLRYLIRMRSRSTPFGRFAGVALARWSEETNIALNGIDRARIRPDMEWLTALVRNLEKRDEIRRQLTWMSNQCTFVRGGRINLDERKRGGQSDGSIRATGNVLQVLDAAREPIPYSTLVDQLSADNPAGRDRVEALIVRLWERGLMLTDLMPSPSVTDPLQYVIQKLRPIPQAKTMVLRLGALNDAIRRCESTTDPSKALEFHEYAAAQAKLISNVGPIIPLEVDCSLSLAGDKLHRKVAHRAALAAELLLRLGNLPLGPSRIQRYRQVFLVRYGEGREVPLFELMSRDWGLGPLDAPTQTSAAPVAADARARRAAAVEELAIRALQERKLSVTLDDKMLARLEHEQYDAARVPLSLDLEISVLAETTKAIDQGQFLIAVAPGVGAMGAGRFWGRFADFLGDDLDALRRTTADREQARSSEMIVDLVCLPNQPRAGNICISTPIREYQATYGAVPACVGKSISLDEVMVSVRHGRFLLRWPRGGCYVKFSAGSMLNPTITPQVIHFLLEASQDGVAQLMRFDWGACATYPMLPRLEYKGIVLSPARWHLKTSGETTKEDEICRFIDVWRTSWNVPKEVYLAAGDNRLLLNLDDTSHVRELARDLRTVKPPNATLVEEALPGTRHAWVQGADGPHISEVVVSLVKREADTTTNPANAARYFYVSREQRLRPPGEDWAFLKVYIPAGVQDEALCGPVHALTARAGNYAQIDKWFFIRFADPDPHLRLRFKGPKDWLNEHWIPELLTWGKALIDEGICDQIAIDTYNRELERYGGTVSIDDIETLFHLDSLSVLALLNQSAADPARIDMTALAVATVDDFYHALAPNAETAVQWLRKLSGKSRKVVGDDYRNLKAKLLVYANTRCVEDVTLGPILRQRREEIAPFGLKLRKLEQSGDLCTPVENICASLAHMHLNRLLPIGQFEETRIYGLLTRTREMLLNASGKADAAALVAVP